MVAVNRLNNEPDRISGLALIATFLGVLARQYLTNRDNATLARDLARRENELQRQAFQDILTGLPNRVEPGVRSAIQKPGRVHVPGR